VSSTYPQTNLVLEPLVASTLHHALPVPVYTSTNPNAFAKHVDLIATLGGDGTILHAAALFAHAASVPPILSFSMGSLGFLGEWRFEEHKRAFRDVYMSGSAAPAHQDPWAHVRGKSMGSGRNARILLRNRLKVQIKGGEEDKLPLYAMNEVIIHRGASPHLAVVDVSIGGKFFTSAVADGMIVSTPTGSTAYSLSSGGSIVHPLVPSLLLTPICPRSLSFRPLVLPAQSPILLRLNARNRSEELEISVDGVRQKIGLRKGMEVVVLGEGVRGADGKWKGGVPSVVRGSIDGEEDHWVGGLNGLLKFNYPFGEGEV